MIGLLLLAGGLASDPGALAGTRSASVPDAELLAEAQEQYRAGLEARADSAKARPHFARSAAAFEELWRRGVRNPLLARDLAQAYLLAADLPRAIRVYHRGLRIAPDDPALLAGLAFARDQVAYPAGSNLAEIARPHPGWSLGRWVPLRRVALAAVLLYAFGWLALARAWMKRLTLWWVLGGLMLAASALLGGALWWEDVRQEREARSSLAIVARDGTVLRTGNTADYPPRIDTPLPRGVETRVLAERGGWLQVELAGGAVGWLPRGRVVTVD